MNLMQPPKYTDIKNSSDVSSDFIDKEKSYSVFLEKHKAPYKVNDYYFQSGEIENIQGWILHLSVVLYQVNNLFTITIPVLLSRQVAFKIPIDEEACDLIQSGYMGLSQIGKVLCVYPKDTTEAIDLAKELIELTNSLKGPAVLTDICLGGIVYTRYGSCNPIVKSDSSGKKDYFIYNNQQKLIKDNETIPFSLPKYIKWPFKELATVKINNPKKILNQIYKPIGIIKYDPRGNVYKALQLTGLFKVTKCIIKQGNNYMSSDDQGRDIYDRLLWQKEIYEELHNYIPIPKIFDLFKEDDSAYLVMDLINGISLYDYLKLMNSGGMYWQDFVLPASLKYLHCLINIATFLDKMHKRGFVHRDLAPGNFLLDSMENIYFIDLELVYSTSKQKPTPPFSVGTAGFMSPEQINIQTPTIKEDIYGFGALMGMMLTGLTPVKLDKSNSEKLLQDLYFFIGNNEVASLISSCLDKNPLKRPEIKTIISTLEKYKDDLKQNILNTHKSNEGLKPENLNKIVSSALVGINHSPIVTLNNLWFSAFKKDNQYEGHLNREYAKYPGLFQGIGGVIYLLARAHRMGFDIQESTLGCQKGIEYIQKEYLENSSLLHPGLYDGTAGIAITLTEGIRAGFWEDNSSIRSKIQNCLQISCIDLNLAKGITGQGIAILLCTDFLREDFIENKLKNIVKTLLERQQKDGSWVFPSPFTGNNQKSIGHGYGISGIIYFLLSYSEKHPDKLVNLAVRKALDWLLNITDNLKDLFTIQGFKRILTNDPEIGDERKGCIIAFIKAFEILNDNNYKRIAEDALYIYPSRIVKTDFSQHSGLAGMGELYLEAWRVFEDDEWKNRAHWIANVFSHTLCKSNIGGGYWQLEENDPPTADLMIGNSGIIHFLIRCIDPVKIGYRLLS